MSRLEDIYQRRFSDVIFPVSISSRVLNPGLNKLMMWVSTDYSDTFHIIVILQRFCTCLVFSILVSVFSIFPKTCRPSCVSTSELLEL